MEESNGYSYFDQVVKDAVDELKKGKIAYYFNIEQLSEIVKKFNNTSYSVKDGVYTIQNLDKKYQEKRGKKRMGRIVIYEGKDKEPEIAIKVTLDECIKWGGLGSCDMCGYMDEEFYLCPELGHKALCNGCFNSHKRNVQWYPEDIHFVIDTLIVYCANYKLDLSNYDYKLIDKFFEMIGHPELRIKKLIKIAQEPMPIKDDSLDIIDFDEIFSEEWE